MNSLVVPVRVPLANVFNLRDIGGYRTTRGELVVRGAVFRADGLNRLDESDAAVVATLGIRTVVDLRTDVERERSGTAPTDLLGADAHHLPLISELWPLFEPDDDHDPVAYLIERYQEMTIIGADSLRSLLELLASEPTSMPVVFHCSAGKDRTGVVAAVLLGLLGVADDQIAADYAHSSAAMSDLSAWVMANGGPWADAMTQQPPTFLECPVEAMEGFLLGIAERHGSMEGFVRSIGVSDPTIDEIRARMLT